MTRHVKVSFLVDGPSFKRKLISIAPDPRAQALGPNLNVYVSRPLYSPGPGFESSLPPFLGSKTWKLQVSKLGNSRFQGFQTWKLQVSGFPNLKTPGFKVSKPGNSRFQGSKPGNSRFPNLETPVFKVSNLETPGFKVPNLETPGFKVPNLKTQGFKPGSSRFPNLETQGFQTWKLQFSRFQTWRLQVSRFQTWKLQVSRFQAWKLETPGFQVSPCKIAIQKVPSTFRGARGHSAIHLVMILNKISQLSTWNFSNPWGSNLGTLTALTFGGPTLQPQPLGVQSWNLNLWGVKPWSRNLWGADLNLCGTL